MNKYEAKQNDIKLEFYYKENGLPQTFMVVHPASKSDEVLGWLNMGNCTLINIKPKFSFGK